MAFFPAYIPQHMEMHHAMTLGPVSQKMSLKTVPRLQCEYDAKSEDLL